MLPGPGRNRCLAPQRLPPRCRSCPVPSSSARPPENRAGCWPRPVAATCSCSLPPCGKTTEGPKPCFYMSFCMCWWNSRRENKRRYGCGKAWLKLWLTQVSSGGLCRRRNWMPRWPTPPMPPHRGKRTKLRPGWPPSSARATGWWRCETFYAMVCPWTSSRACHLRTTLQFPAEVLVLYQELSDNRPQTTIFLGGLQPIRSPVEGLDKVGEHGLVGGLLDLSVRYHGRPSSHFLTSTNKLARPPKRRKPKWCCAARPLWGRSRPPLQVSKTEQIPCCAQCDAEGARRCTGVSL